MLNNFINFAPNFGLAHFYAYCANNLKALVFSLKIIVSAGYIITGIAK